MECAGEPWGNTFNVTGGDTVAFNNTYNGPSWISTLVDTTTGNQVQSTFPLLGKHSTMNPVVIFTEV